MKANVLTKINMIIAFLLGLLGFSSCENNGEEITAKYGIPPGMDVIVPMYGVQPPEYTPVDKQNAQDEADNKPENTTQTTE